MIKKSKNAKSGSVAPVFGVCVYVVLVISKGCTMIIIPKLRVLILIANEDGICWRLRVWLDF